MWVANTAGGKGKSRTLAPRWTGPYFIVKKLSDLVYRLRRRFSKKEITLHHDRLKPYVKRKEHLQLPRRRKQNDSEPEICTPIPNDNRALVVDSDSDDDTHDDQTVPLPADAN